MIAHVDLLTRYRPGGDHWGSKLLAMNTEYDPEAVEIVLRSGIPVTFIGGAVTSQCELLPHHVDRIKAVAEETDSSYHRFMYLTTMPWTLYNVQLRNVNSDGVGEDELGHAIEGSAQGAGAAMHGAITHWHSLCCAQTTGRDMVLTSLLFGCCLSVPRRSVDARGCV